MERIEDLARTSYRPNKKKDNAPLRPLDVEDAKGPQNTYNKVPTDPYEFIEVFNNNKGLAGNNTSFQRSTRGAVEQGGTSQTPSPLGYVTPALNAAPQARAHQDPAGQGERGDSGQCRGGASVPICPTGRGVVMGPHDFSEAVLTRECGYVLIEFCCSANSQIGVAAPAGAIVIRCTGKANDDVLKNSTLEQLEKVIDICRSRHVPLIL